MSMKRVAFNHNNEIFSDTAFDDAIYYEIAKISLAP